MNSFRLMARVSTLALMAACSASAFAQTAAEIADQGDIIVTALKRSANLQDIPAAVSAVSGDDLQARGLTSVEDLTQAIPSVNFGEHTGTTLITIRGVPCAPFRTVK